MNAYGIEAFSALASSNSLDRLDFNLVNLVSDRTRLVRKVYCRFNFTQSLRNRYDFRKFLPRDKQHSHLVLGNGLCKASPMVT
jgi:hypothetical protein